MFTLRNRGKARMERLDPSDCDTYPNKAVRRRVVLQHAVMAVVSKNQGNNRNSDRSSNNVKNK
jgi:hypothetical protein